MSRIAVGFHRIGIVLAVPLVGLGLVVAAIGSYENKPGTFTFFACFVGAAIAVYAACRGVGWIVRGFVE